MKMVLIEAGCRKGGNALSSVKTPTNPIMLVRLKPRLFYFRSANRPTPKGL